jgi:hypothetical protein
MRYPKPGELWRVRAYDFYGNLINRLILVKDCDSDDEDNSFSVACHLDCNSYDGIYESDEWDWQLVQSI